MTDKIMSFPFLKYRKIYYIVCIVLIIAGMGIGIARGFNFGIDFIGGSRIQINMGQEVPVEDIKAVVDSVQGLNGDVVRAGDDNKQIIIKTTDSVDSTIRQALIKALSDKYKINEDAIVSVENISASVGDTLKNNAVKAVIVSILLMLIYIAIRFQWKYGVAAIIALANTILIDLAFYGAFNIPINSPFIAAILTILGYGINDTIVIFDRIRENNKFVSRRGADLEALVDKSIHQTLGRSIMTSMTTVVVMIPMLIICGSTIRAFILPIMIGVIASTCSSIFIATSVWFEINQVTDKKSYNSKVQNKKKTQDKAGKTAKPATTKTK